LDVSTVLVSGAWLYQQCKCPGLGCINNAVLLLLQVSPQCFCTAVIHLDSSG